MLTFLSSKQGIFNILLNKKEILVYDWEDVVVWNISFSLGENSKESRFSYLRVWTVPV